MVMPTCSTRRATRQARCSASRSTRGRQRYFEELKAARQAIAGGGETQVSLENRLCIGLPLGRTIGAPRPEFPSLT